MKALETDIQGLEGGSLPRQFVAHRLGFAVMLDHLRTQAGDTLPGAVAVHKTHCSLQAARDKALDSVLLELAGRRGPSWHLLQNHMLVPRNGVFFDLLHQCPGAGPKDSLDARFAYCHIAPSGFDPDLAARKEGFRAAQLPSALFCY